MRSRRLWIPGMLGLAALAWVVGVALRPGAESRDGELVLRRDEGVQPPTLKGLAGDPARADERRERGSGRPSRLSGPAYQGSVFDGATGLPLQGATVTFRGAGGTSETLTDERGTYRIRVAKHTHWYERLHFAKAGYVPYSVKGFVRLDRSGHLLRPVGLRPVSAHLPGRVVDHEDRPLGGVHVRVQEGDPPHVSGPDGRFGPVAVGGRQVHWVAWGPDCARSDDYLDLEPVRPREILVRVLPHDYVPGTVVDETGSPVAGAEVHWQGHHDELRVRTDADGSFRWPWPLGSGARLVAVAGDRAGKVWARCPIPTRIVVRPMEPGAWRWTFRPTRGPKPPPSAEVASRPKVDLRVLPRDATGSPLAFADVRVKREGGGFWEHERTSPEGACEFRIPSGLELVLEVSHHRGGTARLVTSFDEGRSHECPVVLRPRTPTPSRLQRGEEDPPPPTCIAGKVLSAGGRPYPGVWVHAEPWGGDCSDEWGRFHIPGGPTVVAVDLWVEGDDVAPFSVPAVCGGPEVVIRMPTRSAIRVRPTRPPSEDAVLQARVWDWPWVEEDLLGYRDSSYVLDDGDGHRIDCAVGTYAVAVQLDPGAWALYRDVRVRAGKETVLAYDFPTFGRLEGWVQTAEGKPIEHARVKVAATEGVVADTDVEGHFEVDFDSSAARVPAGTHRLRVDAEGYLPTVTRPVDLGGTSTIRVVLQPGVAVRGHVVDAAGKPVVALVGWLTDTGQVLYEVESWADDGLFEFEGALPPGPARLVVRRENRAPVVRRVEVPAGSADVEFRLEVP